MVVIDTNCQPAWRILLIGGSSGTGKTVASRRLAQQYGISMLLVDDIRMAIQAVTTPVEQPALHTFMMEGRDAAHSPESIHAGLVAVAEAMEPALRMIMAHHLVIEGAGPIIIEGDGIMPRLASAAYLRTQLEFRGIDLDNAVKGIILAEAEHEIICNNMLARGRGFQNKPAAEQYAFSEGSWQFGRFLVNQAQKYDVGVLPSRPFETLSERIQQAIIE